MLNQDLQLIIKLNYSKTNIMNEIKFTQTETFEAYREACAWLDKNGYSYGSMCNPLPTGILKGDFIIAKYRNLTKNEISELDGTITGNYRNGPVTIKLF